MTFKDAGGKKYLFLNFVSMSWGLHVAGYLSGNYVVVPVEIIFPDKELEEKIIIERMK